MFANSALAANTLVRSLAGAGFPLFAGPMYHNLGVPWATSLLAFIALAMMPVPVLFYIYGKKIRSMSSFNPQKLMGGPPAGGPPAGGPPAGGPPPAKNG